jgi:hypothetical protein
MGRQLTKIERKGKKKQSTRDNRWQKEREKKKEF